MFYLYLFAVIKISNYYFLPAHKFTLPRIFQILGQENAFNRLKI